MARCPKCEGKGFTELEHGLIQVKCEDCGGTGEIPDGIEVAEGEEAEITGDGTGEVLPETKVIPQGIDEYLLPNGKLAWEAMPEGEIDDSSSRTGQLDSDTGSKHPSKPKQRKKRKAKKQASKRSS